MFSTVSVRQHFAMLKSVVDVDRNKSKVESCPGLKHPRDNGSEPLSSVKNVCYEREVHLIVNRIINL